MSPQRFAAVPFLPFGRSNVAFVVGSSKARQTLEGLTAMVTSTMISSSFNPVPVCQESFTQVGEER